MVKTSIETGFGKPTLSDIGLALHCQRSDGQSADADSVVQDAGRNGKSLQRTAAGSWQQCFVSVDWLHGSLVWKQRHLVFPALSASGISLSQLVAASFGTLSLLPELTKVQSAMFQDVVMVG